MSTDDVDLDERRTAIERTADLIESFVGKELRFDTSLLKALHTAMCADDSRALAGQFRNTHTAVRRSWPGTGRADEITAVAPPKDIERRVAQLCAELNASDLIRRLHEGTRELLDVHPFEGGNGRCARALMALNLRHAGKLVDRVAVIDFLYRFMEVDQQKERIGEVYPREATEEAVLPWLEYFAGILAALGEGQGRMPATPSQGPAKPSS